MTYSKRSLEQGMAIAKISLHCILSSNTDLDKTGCNFLIELIAF